MKKDFFKPLDFIYDDDLKFTANTAANLANEKLNKLIESWPVVYGTKDNNGQHFHENTNGNYNPTLKARLAFIEEIKKEPEIISIGKSKNSLAKFERKFSDGSVQYSIDAINWTPKHNLVEPCKHEPGAYQASLGETIRCCHCNVPLIAEWREVK